MCPTRSAEEVCLNVQRLLTQSSNSLKGGNGKPLPEAILYLATTEKMNAIKKAIAGLFPKNLNNSREMLFGNGEADERFILDVIFLYSMVGAHTGYVPFVKQLVKGCVDDAIDEVHNRNHSVRIDPSFTDKILFFDTYSNARDYQVKKVAAYLSANRLLNEINGVSPIDLGMQVFGNIQVPFFVNSDIYELIKIPAFNSAGEREQELATILTETTFVSEEYVRQGRRNIVNMPLANKLNSIKTGDLSAGKIFVMIESRSVNYPIGDYNAAFKYRFIKEDLTNLVDDIEEQAFKPIVKDHFKGVVGLEKKLEALFAEYNRKVNSLRGKKLPESELFGQIAELTRNLIHTDLPAFLDQLKREADQQCDTAALEVCQDLEKVVSNMASTSLTGARHFIADILANTDLHNAESDGSLFNDEGKRIVEEFGSLLEKLDDSVKQMKAASDTLRNVPDNFINKLRAMVNMVMGEGAGFTTREQLIKTLENLEKYQGKILKNYCRAKILEVYLERLPSYYEGVNRWARQKSLVLDKAFDRIDKVRRESNNRYLGIINGLDEKAGNCQSSHHVIVDSQDRIEENYLGFKTGLKLNPRELWHRSQFTSVDAILSQGVDQILTGLVGTLSSLCVNAPASTESLADRIIQEVERLGKFGAQEVETVVGRIIQGFNGNRVDRRSLAEIVEEEASGTGESGNGSRAWRYVKAPSSMLDIVNRFDDVYPEAGSENELQVYEVRDNIDFRHLPEIREAYRAFMAHHNPVHYAITPQELDHLCLFQEPHKSSGPVMKDLFEGITVLGLDALEDGGNGKLKKLKA